MAAGGWDIQHRQAIDVDAEQRQIMCHEAGSKANHMGACVAQQCQTRGGGIGSPMRRTQALDTPALLIDQHRSRAPDTIAKLGHQAGDLGRRLDIAPEQYQAPGLRLAQKHMLARGQAKAGAAADEGSGRHGCIFRLTLAINCLQQSTSRRWLSA